MKKIFSYLRNYQITGFVSLFSSSFLLLTLTGCSILSTDNIISTPPVDIEEIEKLIDKPTPDIQGELPQEIISKGELTLNALRDFNYELVEELIHPDICLRFSPYPYMADSNLTICPGDLIDISNSENILEWGNYDGTGDPIRLTFTDYHNNFIYDSDYSLAPIIGLNVEVSSGNSINNISEIFPDGIMIEYYFPGFEAKYGGMDWRSLRLVFINANEVWYLVAIIHGEWTI